MRPGRVPANPLAYALNNKARVEILRYMARQGPGKKMRLQELSEALGRTLSVVGYHVQVLDECGAILVVDDPEPADSAQRFYVFNVTEPWALEVLREENSAQ